MTRRQYWNAASFNPCLFLPPAPRDIREAAREPLPPAGTRDEGGRELVRKL